jgi:hypothetical protein
MAEWNSDGKKTALQVYRHNRYLANKDTVNAQAAAWAAAHPEEVKAIKKKSAAKRVVERGPRPPGKPKDPVKVSAYNKKHYDENREAMQERAKKYKKENPEKVKATNKLRYATPEAAAATAESTKAWARANPERYAEIRNLASIKNRLKKYGLTPEQYGVMLAAQGFKCAICGSDHPRAKRSGTQGPKRKLVNGWPTTARIGDLNWHVDHSHSTGAVRGLLCHGCNTGLGLFRDDPKLLAIAINYLMKSKETGE